MCNDNYAANVRRLMPQEVLVLNALRLFLLFLLHFAVASLCKLDNGTLCGVNIFTLMPLRTFGADGAGEARQQALKDGGSPRRGHAQSDAREGARSKVLGKRVLRSARRRAGQVRDVAP